MEIDIPKILRQFIEAGHTDNWTVLGNAQTQDGEPIQLQLYITTRKEKFMTHSLGDKIKCMKDSKEVEAVIIHMKGKRALVEITDEGKKEKCRFDINTKDIL